MEQFDIYSDIAARTNGDIYIGVVGPVRTGKSTFVTKVMESLVLPNIKNKNARQRATDELPQAGDGQNGYDHSTKIRTQRSRKNKAQRHNECQRPSHRLRGIPRRGGGRVFRAG